MSNAVPAAAIEPDCADDADGLVKAMAGGVSSTTERNPLMRVYAPAVARAGEDGCPMDEYSFIAPAVAAPPVEPAESGKTVRPPPDLPVPAKHKQGKSIKAEIRQRIFL